jgi:hypothetical protein
MTKQARKAHYATVVNALCNGRLVPFLGAGGAATGERPYRARFLRSLDLSFDVFQTAYVTRDSGFIASAGQSHVCEVPATEVRATDFHLSEQQRAQLVGAGRLAASSFLDDFDLAGYVHGYGRAFATARQEAQV